MYIHMKNLLSYLSFIILSHLSKRFILYRGLLMGGDKFRLEDQPMVTHNGRQAPLLDILPVK